MLQTQQTFVVDNREKLCQELVRFVDFKCWIYDKFDQSLGHISLVVDKHLSRSMTNFATSQYCVSVECAANKIRYILINVLTFWHERLFWK